MPRQRQASVTQQYGFEQYGNLLLKRTTQADGLKVARSLTAEGRPYHMTSTEETMDLIEKNPGKVIWQKANKSVVLTSEVSKFGGSTAVYLDDGDWRLHVCDFGYPGDHGWVVLAPGASETAAPQSTEDVVQERIAAIKRTAPEALLRAKKT